MELTFDAIADMVPCCTICKNSLTDHSPLDVFTCGHAFCPQCLDRSQPGTEMCVCKDTQLLMHVPYESKATQLVHNVSVHLDNMRETQDSQFLSGFYENVQLLIDLLQQQFNAHQQALHPTEHQDPTVSDPALVKVDFPVYEDPHKDDVARPDPQSIIVLEEAAVETGNKESVISAPAQNVPDQVDHEKIKPEINPNLTAPLESDDKTKTVKPSSQTRSDHQDPTRHKQMKACCVIY